MEVINEAYFGKTKGVLNIEKAISSLRKKYLQDDYDIYDMDDKINLDPGIQKINKAFEDCFGFGVCDFEILFNVKYNAFTLPVSLRYDVNDREQLEITPTGYRYKKSADIALMIKCNYRLFASKDFSDAEVTAILLHEIGHNFSGAVNRRIGAVQGVGKSLALVTTLLHLCILNPIPLLLLSNSGAKWLINFKRQLAKDFPGLVYFTEIVSRWYGMFSGMLSELIFMQNLLTCVTLPLKVVAYVISMIARRFSTYLIYPNLIFQEVYGYSDEKFADQFATMYGYGPELHSSMDKLTTNNGLLTSTIVEKKTPFLAMVYDLCFLPILIVVTGIDPHPAMVERLESSIRVLKLEAEHCRNPKMKKRLKQDIAVLENQRDEYYLQAEIFKKKNGQVNSGYFTRVYYAAMFGIFGGDTRHHIFDRIFNSGNELTSKSDDEFKKGD